MPINMVFKSSTDTDTAVAQFSANTVQSVTFKHTSGIIDTEIIDGSQASYDMVMDATCNSGDPSVTEDVRVTVGTCTYDIAIPCDYKDYCSSQPARRMHEEAFTSDIPKEDGDDEDGEDTPYCLAADFPCEGEEENMAYICHYIPRQGYQTFCVPEGDTVILGFYPHDYCGPCEGGYRSVEK